MTAASCMASGCSIFKVVCLFGLRGSTHCSAAAQWVLAMPCVHAEVGAPLSHGLSAAARADAAARLVAVCRLGRRRRWLSGVFWGFWGFAAAGHTASCP